MYLFVVTGTSALPFSHSVISHLLIQIPLCFDGNK